jgi:hypothetical protein
VVFGRSRESRTREAAGRRNSPEAVPRKMRGRKRTLAATSWNHHEQQMRISSKRGEAIEMLSFHVCRHQGRNGRCTHCNAQWAEDDQWTSRT